MGHLAGFFSHPWQSIGGVFSHPGQDWSTIVKALPSPVKDIVNPARLVGGDVGYVINHPGHTNVGKFATHNPLLVVAVAADVLTYGGASGWVAAAAGASSGYLNAAAAGTYASGAAHGVGGLRNEFHSGPSKSNYLTGAEWAAAYGVGTYEGDTGFAAWGKGLGTISAATGFASQLGLSIPGPTLPPNYTPEQLTNAQLQSDLTGAPINYQNSTTGGSSSGGVGAPGSAGVLGGGAALNATGLALLGAAAVVADLA